MQNHIIFLHRQNIETTSSHLDGYINLSFPCFDDPQGLGSHPTFDHHESQPNVGAWWVNQRLRPTVITHFSVFSYGDTHIGCFRVGSDCDDGAQVRPIDAKRALKFLDSFHRFRHLKPDHGIRTASFTIHWTLASATEAAFVDLMWSLIDSSCFTHSPSLLDAMELPPSTRATVKPHHWVTNSAEPIPSRTSRALKFWIKSVSISLDITNSWHVARWNHEPISSQIPLSHGIPWYPFPHLQPWFLALSSARPSAWFCVSRSASSGNRGWSQDRTSGTSWGWGLVQHFSADNEQYPLVI